MAITDPTVIVPADQTVAAWLRRQLAWMLTGVGVVAAGVLLSVIVFDRDSTSTEVVEPGLSAVQPESITAIDHRAEAKARADRQSITAIDHRADIAGD